MCSALPESDGLYDEVCDALAYTFGVNRKEIEENTPLRALKIEAQNLGLGLASFALKIQVALRMEDLTDVLGGMDPQPGASPENPEVLLQRMLDIHVNQLVALVRTKIGDHVCGNPLDNGM